MRQEVNTSRSTVLLKAVGRVAFALVAAALVLALIALAGWADLLKPAGDGAIGEFNDKLEQVKGPATAAFASIAGVALVAGAAMMGMGLQQGIRMMTLSGLSGAGLLLGWGLIE